MYAEFDLLTPAGVAEAIVALARTGDTRPSVPLGGGTNLIVDIRAKRFDPAALVSVGRLPGLTDITLSNGIVTVGAAVTVSQLLRHPEKARFGAAILDAAGVFAGQMVRNAATIAGNICCGSPAADLVPPLLALDAEVTLESQSGRRNVALSSYFTGFKTSVRRPDELLTRISWREPDACSSSAFYKLARRKGDAITMVGVAVSLAAEDGRCKRPRIALGAVSPFVKRVTSAERILEGAPFTTQLAQAAAEAAMAESSPIDDVRATAGYRKQQVEVLVRRLLTQVWQNIPKGGTSQ